MRIVKILECSASLRSTLRNAFIDFSRMTLSVVAVVTDEVRDGKPVVGFGFNSNGRYAQGGVLRERLIPRILEAKADSLLDADGENFDPARVHACMLGNEKPGGHGERAFAVGAIDAALWDAIAKIEEKPLYKVFSERFNDGRYDQRVNVYPGGGYYDADKGVQGLIDEMQKYRDDGYTLMKMKVGGASLEEDCARIEAVLAVTGGGHNLAVDANGALDLETARTYAERVDAYDLAWFEEPVNPLDFQSHAELAADCATPIAVGENLFSLSDARNLLRHGGLRPDRDWLQFDPSLCYGPTEFVAMLQMSRDYGWSPRRHGPHGGQQLGLALAAGLQLGGTETYPLVFQPFGGFGDDTPIVDGQVAPADVPGIGVESKAALYNTVLKPLLAG
ncbi:MAG: enolase C-terminal domain-like protein [Gammaproteobacteria bacterium]|nr:enolase C-terminal domain-like protein [Gammaproteobacteria bacterium]MDX2462480.1 enolase C-terminal domain-like protein [Gammaproteobacteria bacterium]